MNAAFLKVKCITNLHIGTSGTAYGDIKSEVEKDAVLATPIIPSSGIKGALRDFWRANESTDKEAAVTIFGSDAEEENQSRKGHCKFVSGQLLFRPMRVSKGDRAYCLVTTPELLQVMINTIASFQIKLDFQPTTNTKDLEKALSEIKEELYKKKSEGSAGIINEDNHAIMEVEGYSVSKTKSNSLYSILLEIGNHIPVVIMRTEFFQMVDWPIIARNYLKDGKSANLWYEEFVPHQSYFYFPVLWEKKETEVFTNFIQTICKQPIAFGGNNSVGYGYCTITPMYKE